MSQNQNTTPNQVENIPSATAAPSATTKPAAAAAAAAAATSDDKTAVAISAPAAANTADASEAQASAASSTDSAAAAEDTAAAAARQESAAAGEQPKIKLHTSFQERNRKHRNTRRNLSWGSGVTTGVAFSRNMLHPAFWGAWAAIGLLWLIVTCLPYKMILLLGKGVGALMFKLLKGRRYVVETNLKLAFPEMQETERAKLEREIFTNAGIAVFETGIAWFWPDWRIKRMLLIDDQELARARELAAANTRTIAFTCHMVTLEIGARLYALAIKPGIGVYRSTDHPVWEYIQVKGRLRSNLALVERSDVRSMVRSVMQGHPIWYAPDQDYGPPSSVFVPFFGVKDACTVTGLHDLARIKGVKVQPFWLVREDKGYRLHVLEPFDNFPTEDAVADTVRGNQMVEKMIMSAPGQYLWMHRRFKTVPPGSKGRYQGVE